MTEEERRALGEAWNDGYDTAARCYWHKPRNPFTGQMNDADPADYCVAHGGTGTAEECDANPLPYKDGQPQPCPGGVQ